MAVRSIIRSPMRGVSTGSLGGAVGLPGGLVLSHLIDFTNNRAVINGSVTTIANIPSISGTLNLVSTGQRIAGASNGLIIPLSGLAYPLTFMVEFIRSTDSGGTEVVALLDAGSSANLTMYRIDAGDQLRLRVDATPPGSNQANVGGGTTMTSVPTSVQRAAGRVASGSAQNCRNGTLGTEDTSVTLPTNPTRLIVGVDSSGAQTFTGDIGRVKIFNGVAATDAQLQALSLSAA